MMMPNKPTALMPMARLRLRVGKWACGFLASNSWPQSSQTTALQSMAPIVPRYQGQGPGLKYREPHFGQPIVDSPFERAGLLLGAGRTIGGSSSSIGADLSDLALTRVPQAAHVAVEPARSWISSPHSGQ